MDITPPSKEGERGLSIDIQVIKNNVCEALYLLKCAANTHRDERGTGTETATDREMRVGYSIY